MGYMLSCREEGGYSNEAITVFFVFLRSNLPVLCVAVKKKPGNSPPLFQTNSLGLFPYSFRHFVAVIDD